MASFLYALSTRTQDITDDVIDWAQENGVTPVSIAAGVVAVGSTFLGGYLHSFFYVVAVIAAFICGKAARTVFDDEVRAYANGAYDVGPCPHENEDECDCADDGCECTRCKTAAKADAVSDDARCTCGDENCHECLTRKLWTLPIDNAHRQFKSRSDRYGYDVEKTPES